MKMNRSETNIKNNLQKYRVWKNLTQSKLAKITKISKNIIAKMEQENYYPKYIIRQKLCNYFGISQDQMFSEGAENE